MRKPILRDLLVLAIAPSTRGFGVAVFEGNGQFVDCGLKTVSGDKNAHSLARLEKLFKHYKPGVMILQDTNAENSRRSSRIKELSGKMIARAAMHNVRVALFSDEQVRRVFFDKRQGTKHEIAERIAKGYPDQLGSKLPEKRRAWTSEDSRMATFDATALALVWMHASAQMKGRRLISDRTPVQ